MAAVTICSDFGDKIYKGDWNVKVGSQETPGVTGKFGLGVWNEAGQRLTEFCQENTLVMANILFHLHKRWLYTWTSPDSQYRNQIDYSLCSQRWRSSIQSTKTRPGADCGSDHELLITKFRLKLNQIGERLERTPNEAEFPSGAKGEIEWCVYKKDTDIIRMKNSHEA